MEAPNDVPAEFEDDNAPYYEAEDSIPSMSIMDRANLALITLPVAARTAVSHMLGTTPASKYLDLKSALIIAIVRALAIPQRAPLSFLPFMSSASNGDGGSGARSITDTQRLLNRDPGVCGPLWVSKYTSPGGATPQENAGLADALADVVKRLFNEEGEGRNGKSFPQIKWPEVVPVEAEWTGHRTGAREGATLPTYTDEPERYEALMSHLAAQSHLAVQEPPTVLYLHGGAMYLLDPATHRKAVHRLAREMGGRCYSVRYRLAPQSAFPTQILDALVSYLTLLYPPQGAFHKPVSAKKIVLAGDSAGGNLCLALTRVLLEFQKHNTRVTWQGEERDIPLPAGVAVNSPWLDITNSSPSWQPTPESGRADFDYLPSMAIANSDAINRPSCEAWPANPPRGFIYTETSLATHPLASIFTSSPSAWVGAPPMYICTGWEMLADEILFFTSTRLRGEGAPHVTFEQYEAMPHCFAMVIPHIEAAKRCFQGWAKFVRTAVEEPETLGESTYTFIKAKTLEESPMDPETLAPYTEEQIKERIAERLANVEAGMAADKISARL